MKRHGLKVWMHNKVRAQGAARAQTQIRTRPASSRWSQAVQEGSTRARRCSPVPADGGLPDAVGARAGVPALLATCAGGMPATQAAVGEGGVVPVESHGQRDVLADGEVARLAPRGERAQRPAVVGLEVLLNLRDLL